MALGRLILYAHDVEATVRFYERYFGFVAKRDPDDRIVELFNADGGANLMIHPASKGQRGAQALVKLVFDIADVEAFKQRCADDGLQFGGLEFGPIHRADGYVFANAKDPAGNPISISSRAFRKSA